MKKISQCQHGQTMIEFAIILPTFLLLVVGMLYGGMMYMDYLTADRATGDCATACGLYGKQYETQYINGLKGTKFLIYTAEDPIVTWSTEDSEKKVTVTLVLNRENIPRIVSFFISEQITFESSAPVIETQNSTSTEG